jgi:hypothetical protein
MKVAEALNIGGYFVKTKISPELTLWIAIERVAYFIEL